MMCMKEKEGGLGIPDIKERITAIRTKAIKHNMAQTLYRDIP